MGGHYTYAEVPAGDWARDRLGWDRNPYDRFGHLVQGFVPAILVRELLVRTSPLRGSRWLAPLTVCACLAFSAVFEMLEWLAAVTGGEAADAFLRTQGDVWDTQWDMFCALNGALVALLLLSRVHDRALIRLSGKGRPRAEKWGFFHRPVEQPPFLSVRKNLPPTGGPQEQKCLRR